MSTASPYALYLSKLSATSRVSIASQLRSIARIMGWPLDDVTHFNRINYQEMLQIRTLLQHEGWTPRSINRAQVALKSISQLKYPEFQGTALTKQQVKSLFEMLARSTSATGIRNIALFAVLLGTGLRRSELVALDIKDLDLSKQTLLVRHGKGNKSRTVFLPEWCQQHLQNWLALRSKQAGFLFCPVQVAGKVSPDCAISVSLVFRLIKSKLKRIGVENASPHDLRRTFITRLLEQNVDLNTVRQMAGHAAITTTTIYDKRDVQFMQQAAAALRYE
jgi:integrase/recombinase XerD